MAPPMNLQQWLLWKKMNETHLALENISSLTEEQKQQVIIEIQQEEVIPTRMDRVKYLAYACCATSTRVMCWLFLICVLLIIVFVSCFVTVARIQWNRDINVFGPVIDWNVTHQATYQQLKAARLTRSLKVEHPHISYISINMSSIPQGVMYTPHPEPIILKERVLGISQVLMINSENIANVANLSQETKVLLTDMINEELQDLSNQMIDFELPLGDPRDQDQYIHHKCYQEFAHCYLVKYKKPSPWISEGIIVDQCPLPRIHDPNYYKYQPIWDYYLKIQNIRPQGWTSKSYYGTARMGSFYIPTFLRNNTVSHVLFCSDQLYGKWYNIENNIQENEQLLKTKLYNLTTYSKLKARALPKEWNNQGNARLFRSFNPLDVCNRPEAVLLLNTTYFTYSLWEGDCNYTTALIQNLTECRQPDRLKLKHPYACRFWRYKEGQEEVKCLGNEKKKCLYYSEYSSPEAQFDFGFLSYLNAFPGLKYIENQTVREPEYEVYSLYMECMNSAEKYGIDSVLFALKTFLNFTGTPVNEMSTARAFVGLTDPKFPPTYPNITKEQKRCNNLKRRKRSTNIEKLRSMGYSLTGAVQTLSQISDINDERLQQGVSLLRDHVVTLMEAALHDITIMEGMLAIQHVHTHLNHLKTILLMRKIDWTFIKSNWIKEQLQKTEDEMKIIRRTAKSLVYYVTQTSSSTTATSWEIGIYYEITIPKHIYLNNWQVINIGHLVESAGHLTLIRVKHPYEVINKECTYEQYLHLEDCISQDYVICDTVQIVSPCGNSTTTSDCPVTAEKVKEPYVQVSALKNGSYLVLTSRTDCSIPAYVPSIVTVNETVKCFGVEFHKPLYSESKVSFEPQVPHLKLRLPHLVGIIANLQNLEIEVTSTQESIKDQIERAKSQLLRLDIHEGDFPAWIQQLASATRDVWPAAARALQGIGNVLSNTAQGIFGTTVSILSYAKPILIGIGVILLIAFLFKIVSWLPGKKKRN
ncbi:Env [African green monkey simian foamy virus]|uniref:Envelope glycoprotein gp130 n=1 Tax=Simian foamy virus type 3 (strain LK3) TaxID=11644 RepID=ENV_SFV3L|nr:Env [African green monkey simian foamy virus]P27399.1 RecName: Full=Envelope glycoprotein gp130; AltName: Full=Env polyprotein; Contains: RecName: Full=Leader peptide; Short=LP; AltName: Full=Env leader protein; Short=Elp; AltName: Full=gp18LP; Contains: RecName: Full=Surface protein; Short=SU; AltName: Full=Glycoprotein 80; Short=gp80; Contains: RecName: Full=Transmembrane protein; Short=TM; AltName: Full=Glycoprotein 48; Short=gp48 [Simian foamy virus (TYPE 3 / STRAIN LK3)]pir/VCLJLK/ env po